MNKKVIIATAVLSAGILLLLTVVIGFQTKAKGEDDFRINGTILTAYVGTDTFASVPSTVTSIGEGAFAGNTTRKLAVALLPFIIFGISYDWMRVYPNYEVNPIDVQGLYEAEKSLFGISIDGTRLIPCEYFAQNHCTVGDFFAGIFYLCWVPVPIALGLWLYLKGERKVYLRFAMVFLLVNVIGFAGYYIHPAAPPWYAMNYGFEPVLNTPGNVAGLGRFDELLGCSFFHSIYGRNANICAAVPSLHAVYRVVAVAYADMGGCKKWLIALFSVIMAGIWWTAVYSGHHYLIDVMLGISCALLGILVFEQGLMKWGVFKRFFERYSRYIG